ncbi:methionine biosynthesis protein MetW [Patescibacteria group bacterium]
MKNIYTSMYSDNNKLDLNNPRVNSMLKIIKNLNISNKKILDIGCHDGTFLSLIKNNKLYGLDTTDFAEKECLNKNISFKKFFWDDQDKLPYADNFF